MQCNIENMVMITINYVQMNQILALDNPYEVDTPLNQWTKPTRV